MRGERWSASTEVAGIVVFGLSGLEVPVAGYRECSPIGEVWRTRQGWRLGVWLVHQ